MEFKCPCGLVGVFSMDEESSGQGGETVYLDITHIEMGNWLLVIFSVSLQDISFLLAAAKMTRRGLFRHAL
jgi:hypothetical protein